MATNTIRLANFSIAEIDVKERGKELSEMLGIEDIYNFTWLVE